MSNQQITANAWQRKSYYDMTDAELTTRISELQAEFETEYKKWNKVSKAGLLTQAQIQHRVNGFSMQSSKDELIRAILSQGDSIARIQKILKLRALARS